MNKNELYLKTPLSKAIFQFFKRMNKDFSNKNLEPGSIKAYIFGGCALHIHTNARGSADMDIEFSASPYLREKGLVINCNPVFYQQSGIRQALAFDKNFNPMLPPLHEDYQEDAIQLEGRYSVFSPLWVYVVTAEDLAVSKLGRFGDRDRKDIQILLDKGKMTLESFTKRAKEAINYYPGNTRDLLSKLRMYSENI